MLKLRANLICVRSRVIDSFLLEEKTAHGSARIAYFYCSRTSDDTKRGDPSNVLRSIAKQLAESGDSASLAYTEVASRYEEIMDSEQERDLDMGETINLIINLKEINSCTIIIDGLDECQNRTRGDLLHGLNTIASSPGRTVKIFVASRDDDDINRALSPYPNRCIDAHDNEADIRRYVQEELEKAIQNRLKAYSQRISAKLEKKIQNTLIDEAGGM